MNRPIAIVTNKDYDLHAAVVAERLASIGEPFVFLDLPELMLGCSSFRTVTAPRFEILTDSGCVALCDIKSVWFRRPTPIGTLEHVDPEYRAIVAEEWKYFSSGMWEHLSQANAFWMSHPADIRRAEIKTLQIELASSVGLRMPETLVTNDIVAAKCFFSAHRNRVVVKKLRSHNRISKDDAALFVTRRITDVAPICAESLKLCTVIFQRLIDKAFDVRIVVIGDALFGFKIHSQALAAAQIDYRASLAETKTLKHEPYDPPDDVTLGCLRMCKLLALNFGAFDFVIDENGSHHFLELNANGQWLWLELATEVPLSRHIADRLAAGCKS